MNELEACALHFGMGYFGVLVAVFVLNCLGAFK